VATSTPTQLAPPPQPPSSTLPPPLPSTWPVPQSIGVRLVAYLIDLVIAGIVATIAAGVTLVVAGGPDAITPGSRLLLDVVIWAVSFSYFFLLEGGTGKTAGKAILGLRVVRAAEPWRTTWGGALLRNVLRPVDFIFFGLPGIALIGTTARRQRLGDMAGKTVVVKHLPWNQVPWQFAPAYPGLMPCPLCGGPIWVGMTVCNHCGAYWVPDAQSHDAGSPVQGFEGQPLADETLDQAAALSPSSVPAAPSPSSAPPSVPAAPPAEPPDPAPARDELLALLHDDDGWVRCLAARELVAQDPTDVAAASAALDSCDPLMRLRLVDLLARQPGPASEPLLAHLSSDRNGEVAEQAQGALRFVRSQSQPDWPGPARPPAPAPPTPGP
jgi:uncharacterized RDD family membrane protein YckC